MGTYPCHGQYCFLLPGSGQQQGRGGHLRDAVEGIMGLFGELLIWGFVFVKEQFPLYIHAGNVIYLYSSKVM